MAKRVNFSIIFQKILLFLPFAVLANVLFCYFTIDAEQISQLSSFSVPFFLLSLLMAILPWFTHAIRIFLWTRFIGRRISFVNSFKISVGNDLGAAISPTSIGGEAVKIGMLSESGMKMGQAVSLTILGRMEDILFLVSVITLITLSAVPMQFNIFADISTGSFPLNIIYFVVFVILCILVYTLLPQRFKRVIADFYPIRKLRQGGSRLLNDIRAVFQLIRKNGKSLFILTSLIAILQWLVKYLIIYVLLLSLGIVENPVKILALQWLVFMMMFFVPTPGASVGAEAAFYLLFSTVVPAHTLALVTIGWRFLTFYLPLTLGSILFSLLNLSVFKPKNIRAGQTLLTAEAP